MLAALTIAATLGVPTVPGVACLTANGLSPDAGSGDAVVFEARYGHCEGAAVFRVVQLWIGDEVTPDVPHLNLGYEAGRFFLEGATGDCAPGDAAILTSTHGAFDCAASSVSIDGDEILVRWSLAFDTAAFAGSHGVFFDAKGGAGDPEPRLEWMQLGTFEVAGGGATTASADTSTSATPDTSGGGDDSSTDASPTTGIATGTGEDGGLPGARPDRPGPNTGCGCNGNGNGNGNGNDTGPRNSTLLLAVVIIVVRHRRRTELTA